MSKIANDNPVKQDGEIEDNIILPFQLQASGLRGRAIRLGSELDNIISAHQYPDAISHLLADTITLAATLSSMLKYDGVFTLQASSKGAVKTLVADMTHAGAIRGCATYDEDAFGDLKKTASNGIYDGFSLSDLMGEGYLAFTVDMGDNAERYQGIVSLEGEHLQDSITHYFEQSEQLRTSLYLASRKTDKGWRSGALMLQYLPDDHAENSDIVAFGDKSDKERKEDWHRSKTLLQTCSDDEILDDEMHINELLRRLFHEEGVIIYSEKPIKHECRCSQDRVQRVIDGLSDDDKAHAAKDGKIEMTCEFCSKTYTIGI